MLKGKKILLGISGGIAAYKSAMLCRLLVKQGASVRVVMTSSATRFITPLTLATLSKHPVSTDVIQDDQWNSHVEMGLWADLMLIAPLTANTLAKMAHGIADNLLTLTYYSARCPVMVAPAMDLDMYTHPTVDDNIKSLLSFGNIVIPADKGELASGLNGVGRMAEPEVIVDGVLQFFEVGNQGYMRGTNVMVTAGPTYEDIDPVRFIGNRSSGKMGIAIADECHKRGADVTLILGPSPVDVSHKSYTIIHVTNAQSMYEAASKCFDTSDLVVLSAAVADYRPVEKSDVKIKKSDTTMDILLTKTVDIAATLGKKKRKNQVIVGFALETNNEAQYAKEKLHKKNFDLIVLNSLQDKGAGFQHDTNKITIMDSEGNIVPYGLKTKAEVAKDIIDYIQKIQ